MKIHLQGKNSPVFVLTHVILDLCSVLWINDSVRLFVSWCIWHSLLAHSEHFRASPQLSSSVHKWHHVFGYQCKQLDILPSQETEWSSSGHVWVVSQTGTTSLSSAALCSYSPSRPHSSAHFCVCLLSQTSAVPPAPLQQHSEWVSDVPYVLFIHCQNK